MSYVFRLDRRSQRSIHNEWEKGLYSLVSEFHLSLLNYVTTGVEFHLLSSYLWVDSCPTDRFL